MQAPSETQNLAHCGNPAPNPPARRPEGEVVEGVYRRHPPAGAKEHPLRNANQQNGEHLRRRVRHPLKSCLFSQRGEPGDRVDESNPSTRYGQADCWVGFPRRRTPGRRAPTRHAPDTSLDGSVAHGATCMIFVFPALGTDPAVYFSY